MHRYLQLYVVLFCCSLVVNSSFFQLQPGQQCNYNYHLAIHVHRGQRSTKELNFKIKIEVDVHVLERHKVDDDYYVTFIRLRQPRVIRTNNQRSIKHVVDHNLEEKLAKPFYFLQNNNGKITDVFYPREDSPEIVGLKKGVVSAFHARLHATELEYHTEEEDDSGIHVSYYNVSKFGNSSHMDLMKTWTSDDYIKHADGRPIQGKKYTKSHYHSTIKVEHNRIAKVERTHLSYLHNDKPYTRPLYHADFKRQPDFQLKSSGESQLHLVSCSQTRIQRRSIEEHSSVLANLKRDTLSHSEVNRVKLANVGNRMKPTRTFYELLRCYYDSAVKESQLSNCVKELHYLARTNGEIHQTIVNLAIERSHQNFSTWSALVGALVSRGDHETQKRLATILLSNEPRLLTEKEHEAVLEAVYFIPFGPLYPELYHALLSLHKNTKLGEEISVRAMLVLSALTKRCHSNGYNMTLLDDVMQHLHHSFQHHPARYHAHDSHTHESYLRRHLWAFGNLGHSSTLDIVLPYLDHDNYDIRYCAVSALRKLQPEQTDHHLLRVLRSDDHVSVRAGVIGVFTERRQNITTLLKDAIEDALWKCDEEDELDSAITELFENHGDNSHQVIKQLRKEREIIKRKKRALLPALKPRAFTFGVSKEWRKGFGGERAGAEAIVRFLNEVTLRIGIFGGKFEINLDNLARVGGNVFVWSFDILKGKAAFKLAAGFKNDIPKDLIHVISDTADGILSGIDSLNSIFAKHIQDFINKLRNYLPLRAEPFLEFISEVIDFLARTVRTTKFGKFFNEVVKKIKRSSDANQLWNKILSIVRKLLRNVANLTSSQKPFDGALEFHRNLFQIVSRISSDLPRAFPMHFDITKFLEHANGPFSSITEATEDYFKTLGSKIPEKVFGLLHFKNTLRFTLSMERLKKFILHLLTFANDFIKMLSVFRDMNQIDIPRLQLPGLGLPLSPGNFDFGLSFDWRTRFNFNVDFAASNFEEFQNLFKFMADIFKILNTPNVDLGKFFKLSLPRFRTDRKKRDLNLLKGTSGLSIGRWFKEIIRQFRSKLDQQDKNLLDWTDTVEFSQELTKKTGAFSTRALTKVCKFQEFMSRNSGTLKEFGENIESNIIPGIKNIGDETQLVIGELVNLTLFIDDLIEEVQTTLSNTTKKFADDFLTKLEDSLENVKDVADNIAEFADNSTSKITGFCFKTADISAEILDDIQDEAEKAGNELASFITTNSAGITPLLTRFKHVINNVEEWHQNNLQRPLGKFANVADTLEEFLSLLPRDNKFSKDVRKVSSIINDVIQHLQNLPEHAEKARDSADKVQEFATNANAWLNEVKKINIRRKFKIDFDGKMRKLCNEFQGLAKGTTKHIQGDRLFKTFRTFVTKETDQLISRMLGQLKILKEPVGEARNRLEKVSGNVNEVEAVLAEMRPFSDNFSPILNKVHLLPKCSDIEIIFDKVVTKCWNGTVMFGKQAYGEYQDLKSQVGALLVLLPDEWESLMKKCIKGGTCISEAFLKQAKDVAGKIEVLQRKFANKGMFESLKPCKDSVEEVTKIINVIKKISRMVEEFTMKDEVQKIEELSRHITGVISEETTVKKRSIDNLGSKVKNLAELAKTAVETKEKVEKLVKDVFQKLQDIYMENIEPFKNNLENVKEKLEWSQELAEKAKSIRPSLQAVEVVVGSMTQFTLAVQNVVDPLERTVLDVFEKTSEFTDIFDEQLKEYGHKVKQVSDEMNNFLDKMTSFLDTIQIRQRGLNIRNFKPWDQYNYCSQHVCLRSLRRSSKLYRETLFVWKYPHLDDLSSFPDTGKWLIPGLFDDYKVRSIAQLSRNQMLLGMQGVAANTDKPSLLVVVDISSASARVSKIFQIQENDAPFTGEMTGVIIIPSSYIWVSGGDKLYALRLSDLTNALSSSTPTTINVIKSKTFNHPADSVSYDKEDNEIWVVDTSHSITYSYSVAPFGVILSQNTQLQTGENTRSVTMIRQFGKKYACLAKCSLTAGYQCRLEFHSLDTGVLDGSTLHRVVRTPSGLEAVQTIPDGKTIITAFSSATYSEKSKIERIAGDFEDRFFKLKLPILSTKFSIYENCVYLKVGFDWIIPEKKLFPVGDMRCGSRRKRDALERAMETDVYSEELEQETEHHRRMRRQAPESLACVWNKEGEPKRSSCPIVPEIGVTVPVFGIAVYFFFGADGHYYINWKISLCLRDRQVKLSLIPGAWVTVYGGASLGILIVEAGVTVEAKLIETYLIPELTVRIDKWPLHACLELKMQLTPLSIRVYLWYRFRLCPEITFGGWFGISIKINWCPKKTFAEWSWSTRSINKLLFSNCKKEIDSSPPTTGECTAKQVSNKRYYVQWHGFTEDTKIQHYIVTVGSVRKSGDDHYSILAVQQSLVISDLDIKHGRSIYVSVAALNDQGEKSHLAECPVFTAKRRSPVVTFINDGNNGDDVDYQSDDTRLSMSYGLKDNFEEILRVQWGISSSPECNLTQDGADVLSLRDIGDRLSVTKTGMDLRNGVQYYTRVVVINLLGLATVACSDGVTIDTTPPLPQTFVVDKYIPSTRRVKGEFESFLDSESPLIKYEWKMVNDETGTDESSFEVIPLAQRKPLIDHVNLIPGRSYTAVLRGTNAVGLSSTVNVSGIVPDDSRAVCRTPVADVLTFGSVDDEDFVRELSNLTAFFDCYDEESGIESVEAAIGTFPGGANIYEFVNIVELVKDVHIQQGTWIMFSHINITSLVRYHITIRIKNGVGFTTTVTSDGILMDTTPPNVLPSYIRDGYSGVDKKFSNSSNTFPVHWENAFTDAESGISEYFVGLGTTPGSDDQLAFTSYGKQQQALISGVTLECGVVYYVTVIGCNGVHMCVNGTSNGALVDFIPPHTGLVKSGNEGPPVKVTWLNKAVWARWNWCSADKNNQPLTSCGYDSFYDTHSGIKYFGLSVLSYDTAELVVPIKTVGRVVLSGRHVFLPNGVFSVLVEAEDRAGVRSNALSESFIIDSTPPIITTLHHGHRNKSIMFTRNTVYTFTAHIEIIEDVSHIISYSVGVGSYAGADDVISLVTYTPKVISNIFSVDWTASSQTTFRNPRKYFITVKATNSAGLFLIAASQPLIFDNEVPRVDRVLDGWGTQDAQYHAFSSLYRIHWRRINDFSGIREIEVCLSSDKNNCDLYPKENISTKALSYTFTNLTLRTGGRCYGLLHVVDNADNDKNYWSDGTLIDLSSPNIGKVVDGGKEDLDYQSESNILHASWSGFTENETFIHHYELAFGTATDKADIQPFTDIGLVESAASSNLVVSQLQNGVVYYAHVIAYNVLGLPSERAVSNGVLVDTTSPNFTLPVSDGKSPGTDGDYTTTRDSLSSSWKCNDEESGLRKVFVAFGTQPGVYDVLSFKNVLPYQTSYTMNNLSLLPGFTYFATVKCVNKVGLYSSLSSNGITIDSTPPSLIYLNNGWDIHKSTSYFALNTSLKVNWKFLDPESHIKSYHISINKYAGDTTVVGPINLPGNQNAFELETSGNNVKHGGKYYFIVTAQNGAGITATGRTGDFIIDGTPPRCIHVYGTTTDGQRTRFSGQNNKLAIHFQCMDQETKITSYHFAIKNTRSNKVVLPFHRIKKISNVTSFAVVDGSGKVALDLKNGERYQVGIRVINQVMLKNDYWSDDIAIDLTPPVFSKITPNYDVPSGSIEVLWQLKDSESGIKTLLWALSTVPDSDDPGNFTSISINATELEISGMTFALGQTYYVYLQATNEAGLSTVSVSDGVVIDRTAPTRGEVSADFAVPVTYDGNPNVANGASFSVKWTGFLDPESGIKSYDWAIVLSQADIKDIDDNLYTTIRFVGTLNGYVIKNQTIHSNTSYYVCIRATNGAGLQTLSCSIPVLVQLGRLTAGIIYDGLLSEDIDFQLDDKAVRTHWEGFEDPVYGLEKYEWCYDLMSNGDGINCSTSAVYPPLKTIAHQFHNVSLTNGQRYGIKVVATNKRDQTIYANSDGFTVDRSAPLAGTIKVGGIHSSGTIYLTSMSPPILSWTMNEPESELRDFEISIGSIPRSADILYVSGLNGKLRHVDSGEYNFKNIQGMSFFVTVVGVNVVGLASSMLSSQVIVDLTPASVGKVYDGSVENDVEYQSDDKKLAATWMECLDPESGISEYLYCIGTAPDICDVTNMTSVMLDLEMSVQLELVHGTTYFVTLMTVNNAGLSTTTSSNGITIDATPPTVDAFTLDSAILIPEKVSGVSDDVKAVSTNIWSIMVSWNSINDEESGIERVSLCVGTNNTNCGIKAWFDVNVEITPTNIRFPKQLHTGDVFVVGIKVRNGAGLEFVTYSHAVVIDVSPPVQGVVTVNNANNFVILKDDSIAVKWKGFKDPESNVKYYKWKICPMVDNTICISEFAEKYNRSSLLIKDTGLQNGKESNIVMKAVNFGGLQTEVISNSFMLDKTFPEAGIVFDGSVLFEDQQFQSETSQITAVWNGFKDKESCISRYEVCVGTLRGLCDIANYTNVDLQTTGTIANLNLTHNTTYYTTVKATNRAGLAAIASSNGILLDATSPIGGELRDGDDDDEDITKYDSFVAMNWDDFHDPESDVVNYVLCAGSTRGACDILPEVATTQSSLKHQVWPSIASGTTVYSTLKVNNKAGGITTIHSDGILIDSTKPDKGKVVITSSHEMVNVIAYLIQKDELCFSWSGFNDTETGVLQNEYSLCSTGDNTCFITSLNVGQRTSLCIDVPDIIEGQKYFIQVEATNQAGLASIAQSHLFVVDTTEPDAGDVTIKNPLGDQYQFISSEMVAQWTEFIDVESGIKEYVICIGTQPGLCDIVGETTVGNDTRYRWSNLDLHQEQEYFVFVRAENNAGKSTNFTSSSPISVDKTAPDPVKISDGPDPLEDIDYQREDSYIRATWFTIEDPESGVADLRWCVGSQPRSCDLREETMLRSEEASVSGYMQPLNAGKKFFVTVLATNGAGSVTSMVSNGVLVDYTPPSGGTVILGDLTNNYMHGDEEILHGRWSGFEDLESDIKSYKFALCEKECKTVCPLPFSDIGLETNVTISGTKLSSGIEYILIIRAQNMVGLEVDASSNSITVDTTPPIAGYIIIDGPKYRNKNREISARWGDFVDAESSIKKFEVCLGITESRCEVKSFEDVGVKAEYTFSSIPLLHKESYYVTVKAVNKAGLSILHTSKGITIDLTPPTLVQKLKGYSLDIEKECKNPSDGRCDAQKQQDDLIDIFCVTDLITAQWPEYEDEESGIGMIKWCVETLNNTCDVRGWTRISKKLQTVSAIIPSLPKLDAARVLLEISNGVGNHVILTSPSCHPRAKSPPQIEVKEVAKLQTDQLDIDYQTKSERIFVIWSLSRNNSLGLSKIQAALTTPLLHVQDSFLKTWNGEVFVYDFVDIPLERDHIVFKGEELKPYTKYHSVVRLWNEFGVYTDSVSDGIVIVPDSPPNIHVGTRDEFRSTENERWKSLFDIPNVLRDEFDEGTRFIPDPFHVRVSALPVNENETGLNDHKIKITYKTSVYRVRPSANETRNDTIEEKVIFDHSHVHNDLDVCCTKNNKKRMNQVLPDKQLKPVIETNGFGYSVAILNNNLIAVSSKDTLFILSEKEAKALYVKRFTSSANDSYVKVKTKRDKLVVSSGGKVILYDQTKTPEIKLQCYFTHCNSSTIDKNPPKCDDDNVWSTWETVGSVFAYDGNNTMIISGKSPSHNNSIIGIFQQRSNSLVWSIVQILSPRNDTPAIVNIMLNTQFLVVLFENSPKYFVYKRGNTFWQEDKQRSKQLQSVTDRPTNMYLTEDNEVLVVSAKFRRLFVIDLYSVKTKCTYSMSSRFRPTGGLDVLENAERFVGIGGISPDGSDSMELVSFATCSRVGGVVVETGLRFDDGNTGVVVSLSESRIILATPTVYSWPSDHVRKGTGRLYITTFCGRNFRRQKIFNGKQRSIECIPCASGEQAYAGFEEQCTNCSRTICLGNTGPFNFRVSHCNKYPCKEKHDGRITQRVMDDNLTITESAPNNEKDTFYRSESEESYFIRISQLSEVGVETNSDSFPFSIDRTSPEPGFVYDGMGSDDSKNCSANTTFSSQHQCSSRSFSDTDLDFTNDTSEISARWIDFRDNESNIESYFWCIGSQPLRDDIKQCENTTGYPNKTIAGLSLNHGAEYYITIVTCNYAGLCTAKSSDGVLVDTTPPVIHYVRDGLIGPDINFQVFTNALFGNWYAEDQESGIIASEIGWGSSPGLDDVWEFQEVGNVSMWYVSFEDGYLPSGSKYYITVKVINGAGLESQTVSSDGIVVGKSEFIFNKNDSGSFFFDTVDVDSNETRKDSGIGNTYGTLYVPPGAVDDEVKFICESLSEKSITREDSNTTLVNPQVVKPPKKFKMGNYSFQITAYDPSSNGSELSEFHFKKPITITLVYDVDQMLKDNREVVSDEVTTDDIDPVLLLWDVEKKQWYDAAETCPEPWRFVDREAKILKVKVCHLTQFALFWLLSAEHGIIEMQLQNGTVLAGHAVYDNDNEIIYKKEKYGNGIIIDLVRRKGSSGNIQVNWAVSMKPSKRMMVSPSAGHINMTEGQWHASINLTFLSVPKRGATLYVTLTNVSGGAILGDATTCEIVFLEKRYVPDKKSNRIFIIVVSLFAFLVISIIGVVCYGVKRQRRCRQSVSTHGKQSTIHRDNPAYESSYNVVQHSQQDTEVDEN